MTETVGIVTIASSAGIVIGWLAQHFRNGRPGNGHREQMAILAKIAADVAIIPELVRELRAYMTKGEVAMSRLERIDRQEKE